MRLRTNYLMVLALLLAPGAFAQTATDLSSDWRLDDGVVHDADLTLRPTEIREGLFITGSPAGIENAWKATLGLFIGSQENGYGNGSGSIVKIEPSGPSTSKLYILTAYHVAIGGVKVVGASSPMDFIVVTNISTEDTSKVFQRGSDFKPLGYGLKIEKALKTEDLALASLEIKNEDLRSVAKIDLSDCDTARNSTIYGIGFPDASMRKHPSQKFVSKPQVQTKRWSEGVYLGTPYRISSLRTPLVRTTHDVSGGASGGPTVDSQGRLIGVQIRGWSEHYVGYNLDAACPTVMRFLKSAGVTGKEATQQFDL